MNDLLSMGDGLFYPGDKDELDKLVDELLKAAPAAGDPADSIITPHGAYEYCGTHMASAFSALAAGKPESEGNRPERIIVICPLHREAADGIFLTDADGIAIPTGRLSFDKKAADLLKNQPMFSSWEVPFAEEPAMELQLPFIQKLFPDVPVLPLFANGTKKRVRKALAAGLVLLPGSKIIISTNLTEFRERSKSLILAEEFIAPLEGPFPGKNRGTERAAQNAVLFDPEDWISRRKGGLPRPCGIDLLSSYWLYNRMRFPGSTAVMKVLSWGPDTQNEEKAAFYGGFALYPQIEAEKDK